MKWFTEKYRFEWADLTTLVTIVAVILNLSGLYLAATILFIVNCLINLILSVWVFKRINLLMLNIALLIFNVGFLK